MDVCVVTETWMNDNDSVTLTTAGLSPQGYTFRYVLHESDRSGGCTEIIFRDCFNCSLIDSKKRSSFQLRFLDGTSLQMETLQNLSSSIDLLTLKLIWSLPKRFSLKNSLHIWNLLSSVVKTLLSLVISINFHLDDLRDHMHDAMKFTELLEAFELANHVTFPKHINGHWLDLFITRSTRDIKDLSSLSSLYLSDYCFAECSLTFPTPCTTIKEICFRKWKNIGLDVFKKDILDSDLYSLTTTATVYCTPQKKKYNI